MNLTGNFGKPTDQENKNLIPDVAPEDDPSIPEEEKEQIRKNNELKQAKQGPEENKNQMTEQISQTQNAPEQPNPEGKNISNQSIAYITNAIPAMQKMIEKMTFTINNMKNTIATTRTDIENCENHLRNNNKALSKMENEMSNFFEVKAITDNMDKKLDSFKIKWDLTVKPVTQEDLTDKMHSTKWTEEYTQFNNILDQIQKLKTTIENHMEELQKERGSKEYRDLYELGETLERVFNVWPPKLKYFAKNKDKQIELQMEQALLIDVSAAQEAKKMEEALKTVSSDFND